jgi:hypothetical protein
MNSHELVQLFGSAGSYIPLLQMLSESYRPWMFTLTLAVPLLLVHSYWVPLLQVWYILLLLWKGGRRVPMPLRQVNTCIILATAEALTKVMKGMWERIRK